MFKILDLARIASFESQEEQQNGEGVSFRYRVRIHGRMTDNTDELPDEDLPYAQIILPVTAGSGGANYATTPSLVPGDTVLITYLDKDGQIPLIVGVLPRTDKVSTSEETVGGFDPTTGFTDLMPSNSVIKDNESNESTGQKSQPSPRSDKAFTGAGEETVLANTCSPNEYRTDAVSTEINNLLNQLDTVTTGAQQATSLINGTIDRVHALVNPYVGEIFYGTFESLVPVLNSGLSALYDKVFSTVLAKTGNPVTARLAAEAALIALQPAVLALQEAISLLANAVVEDLLGKVADLVVDTVDNNDNFTECAGTQFNGALLNAIINDVDTGLTPLLRAVSVILSGGFNIVNQIRGAVDIIRDFSGGLLGNNQGGNKCGALVKKYVIGVGPKDVLPDLLDTILEAANVAASLVEKGQNTAESLQDTFGDFPFLSGSAGKPSILDTCSTDPPETCFGPEVVIFGGRGEGAEAEAIVGDYVVSSDERTISDVQGGVVSIEVKDGGSGYIYPPFVELRDNCGLGIGAVARAVIKDGSVSRIYIVSPGENYPATGRSLFIVSEVQIIDGGFGYSPGIVTDQFGTEYEVIVNEDGTVTDIIPINIIQVPEIPTINIPTIVPPIPPGGVIVEVPIPSEETPPTIVNQIFVGDKFFATAQVGTGLIIRPLLITLPTADKILAGDLPETIQNRLGQEEIAQIIDCIES